jgi:5'(3')-deoxyribonucleotidase
MNEKCNEFLRQLNWKIEATEEALNSAKRDLESYISSGSYHMLDTRNVEKISVLTEKLEALTYQREAFCGIFEIEK